MSILESKLLTALTELGNALGSGLKSDGVLSPPDDLVKAFEKIMQNLEQNENQENPFNQEMLSEQNANFLKGPAEEIPSLIKSDTNLQVETKNTTHSVDGIDTSQQVGNVEKGEQIFAKEKNINEKIQDINRNFSSQSIYSSETVHPLQSPINESPVTNIQGSEKSIIKEPTSKELLTELNSLLDKIGQAGNTLHFTDLYRVQYIIGMLKIQSQTGMKMSQSVSQGLESILKQKE